MDISIKNNYNRQKNRSKRMNNFRSYLFKSKDYRQSYLIMLVLTALILLSNTCFAFDLDDGIPIDSDIPHSDSIKTDYNVAFIKRWAKSMAVTTTYGNYNRTFSNGSTNVVGGAVIGRGATVKGPVTVIFDGKNINNYGF
jgi:hypothetical protein